jgi:hypothetical protein
MSPETNELEPVATRKCGRCRQEFPTDPLAVPGVVLDWWLCPPCYETLLGPAPLRS